MKKKKKRKLYSFLSRICFSRASKRYRDSFPCDQSFLEIRIWRRKKKKKNRSEESSTGKSRSKTGMETSIVIKKLATSLSRLIIRIIVVVLSRLRVRSKLFREKKNRKVSYPMVDMPRASISSDSRHFVPRSRTLSPTT